MWVRPSSHVIGSTRVVAVNKMARSSRPWASALQICNSTLHAKPQLTEIRPPIALTAGKLGVDSPMWPWLAELMRCAAPGDVWRRLAAAGSVAPALLRWAERLGQALDEQEAASGGAAASGGSTPAGTAATDQPPGSSACDSSSSSSSSPVASDAGTEPDQQDGNRQAQLAEGVMLCVDCWGLLQPCCDDHQQACCVDHRHHAAHSPRDCTLLAAACARVVRHIGSGPHVPGTLFAITLGTHGCLACALVRVGGRDGAPTAVAQHAGLLT